MQSGKQQQILGYFIEEAQEHLNTIEEGLLNLQITLTEPDRINEMFRAAHSVKGGAAMLGFESIQKTAHRLEDCFKVLQEHEFESDQQLESLFLSSLDTLKELLDQLQGPFGLRDEEAEATLQQAEPTFTKLQAYLNHLVGGATEGAAATSTPASQLPANFATQVMGALRVMLQTFKQGDSPAHRQKIGALCQRLQQLGGQNEQWCDLLGKVQSAIANPKLPFKILAPVTIKELKGASELLQAGQPEKIAPSQNMQRLLAKAASVTDEKKVALPVEPNAAAKVLQTVFNREQLATLVRLLQKAI